MALDPIQFSIQGLGGEKYLRQLNAIFDAMDKAKNKQAELNRQIEQLRDRSVGNAGNRKSLIEQIVGSGGTSREALAKVRKELRDTEKDMASLSNKAAGLRITPPDGPLEKHRAEVLKLANAYRELSAAQQKGAAGQNILNDIAQRSRNVNQATTAINNARNTGLPAPQQQSVFGGGLLQSIANVAKFQLASKVIQTLADTITHAEEVVREFDAEFTNLQSLFESPANKEAADAQSKLFQRLEADAIRLGQTTAFTAVEVVKLQTELVKLGLSGQEVLNSTSAIINLSTAVRESADRVALLVGGTQKAFNISTLETTRVVDVLTQSTIQTATSFGYLETALPIVASAAKAANVSFEETTAVLGVLANRGVQASTAGTAFRNILIESAKRGITYKEGLDRIAQSTNKLATAFELFGKRGAVQALILSENILEVGSSTRSLENITISAADVAAKQLTSVQGHVTLLKSAWDGFLITIGNTDVYKNTAKGFLSNITEMLNGISALIQGTASFKDAFAKDKLVENFNIQTLLGSPLEVISKIAYNLVDVTDEAAKLQGVFNKSLENTTTFLQEQAVAGAGIFDKSADAATRFTKEQTTLQTLLKNLRKEGINDQDILNKAASEYYVILEGIRQTLNKTKTIQIDGENIDLSSISVEAIKGFTTIKSLEEALSIFKDTFESTKIGSPAFENAKKQIEAAEARLKQLKGIVDPAKKAKTLLKDLTDQIAKLDEALRNAKTPAERDKILLRIDVLKKQLKEREDAFRDYLRNLRSEQRTQLSDPTAELLRKDIKERIDAETELQISLTRIRESNEKIRNAKIALLQNEAEIRYRKSIQDTFANGDIKGIENIRELERLQREGIQIKVELAIDTLNQGLKAVETKAILAATQNIKDLDERKLAIEDATLNTTQKTLDYNVGIIKQKEATYKVLNDMLGIGLKLTEEEQTKLDLYKLENGELKAQKILLDANLKGEFNAVENAIKIKALQDRAEIDRKLQAGEIKGTGSSLFPDQEEITALEQAAKLKVAITLQENTDLAALDYARVSSQVAALEEAGLATTQDNIRKLDAHQKYLDAQNALDANNDEANDKRQKKLDRARARKQQEISNLLVKQATKFGEDLGKALVDGEGTKDAFKSLAKDIIDILAETERAALGIKLLAALTAVPFSLATVLKLSASIAGISIAAGAAKAIIDKFEYGGQVPKASGIVQGPSHTGGGVKYRVKGIPNYFPELEGGEFVMNKRATARHLQTLVKMNGGAGRGTYKGAVYAAGGIIDNPPTVLAPQQQSLTLSSDSILEQANIIAEKVTAGQIQVMIEQNTSLIKSWQQAMEQNNRLTERIINSEKNSRV
jgi:hypothetical protein